MDEHNTPVDLSAILCAQKALMTYNDKDRKLAMVDNRNYTALKRIYEERKLGYVLYNGDLYGVSDSLKVKKINEASST